MNDTLVEACLVKILRGSTFDKSPRTSIFWKAVGMGSPTGREFNRAKLLQVIFLVHTKLSCQTSTHNGQHIMSIERAG